MAKSDLEKATSRYDNKINEIASVKKSKLENSKTMETQWTDEKNMINPFLHKIETSGDNVSAPHAASNAATKPDVDTSIGNKENITSVFGGTKPDVGSNKVCIASISGVTKPAGDTPIGNKENLTSIGGDTKPPPVPNKKIYVFCDEEDCKSVFLINDQNVPLLDQSPDAK